jgi:hypothetical protein
MTKTLQWHAFYDTTQNLSNLLSNRKITNNSISKQHDFYTINNYVEFNNAYVQQNERELPEWYNTDRDSDIVNEFIDESQVFYDPQKTIKMEIEEYEAYESMMNTHINNEEVSDEESDSDWTTVS